MNHVRSVQLVPFGPAHLTPAYVAWLNDPEVVKFSEQRHKTHTLETCRAYASAMWTSQNVFKAVMLEGRHVGNIAASVDPLNKVADVSILIGEKDLWGKGVGSAAWSIMTADLLKTMRKVTAGTMEVNLGMRTIMDRFMIPDGVKQRHYMWNGRPVNLVYAAMWGVQ